jgi:hypothetical protein
MQFGSRPKIVRVAPGDDAGSTRAATAGGEKGLRVASALFGKRINVRRACRFVAITSVVFPADVVSDEDDEVGSICGGERKRRESATRNRDAAMRRSIQY